MSDQRNALDPNSPLIRRSQGQIVVARGLWHVKPGQAEFRTERLPPLSPGEARVTTEYSAISRGTERLVALGQVPESEWPRMRAPLQMGDFPFPIKYGYSAAGIVTAGRDQLDRPARLCVASASRSFSGRRKRSCCAFRRDVPSSRAVLAANMETALNAHWDAGTAPGDRVLVVGAGIIGLLGRPPRPAHRRNRCDDHRYRSGPRPLRRSARREIRRSAAIFRPRTTSSFTRAQPAPDLKRRSTPARSKPASSNSAGMEKLP